MMMIIIKAERLASLETIPEIPCSPEKPTTIYRSKKMYGKVVIGKTSPKKKKITQARKPGRWVRRVGSSEDTVSAPSKILCHNCSQWLIEDHVSIRDHVTCSCCPSRFCGRCLLSRYGEKIEQVVKGVRWVCPRCRGGCGAGCMATCCNCVSCRKMLNLRPARHLPKTARSAAFNNMHDYLVHVKTGESAAVIASRKKGRGWTSADSHPTVVLLSHGNRIFWGQKGNRSTRSRLKNKNLWGSRPVEAPAVKIQKKILCTRFQVPGGHLQLLKSTFNLPQEIRPKFLVANQETQNLLNEENRTKWPGVHKQEYLHTLEQMENRCSVLKSEDQIITPEQRANKSPDFQTAVHRVSQKQIENLWWPDFQTEENMIIQEILDWIMDK